MHNLTKNYNDNSFLVVIVHNKLPMCTKDHLNRSTMKPQFGPNEITNLLFEFLF